jgi:hypothetical protein
LSTTTSYAGPHSAPFPRCLWQAAKRTTDRQWLILLLGLAAACQTGPAALPDVPTTSQRAVPISTDTPQPTPTEIRVPPQLPQRFQSRYLNPLDSTHGYVDDTCEYLRNRWDPAKAAPGTIVMLIMLHSINQGKPEGSDAINEVLFARMMDELHEQRFQAINMEQLAGFLERNDKIPPRSVVLIQDGRRYPDNFERHFVPYWDTWGWQVVNAWDNQGSTTEPLWEDYVALAQEGVVDFQVYGPTFDPLAKPRTDEYLTGQLQKPVDVLRERFGKAPIGVIWPNGFSSQSARIARELGYRLGFTFNARGPVMYDWIPLSESIDKSRPSYQPEGAVGDPLMTLPRFWPQQVHTALDEVRISGKQAAAYAETVKGTELEYYDIVCATKYGLIPE